MMLSCRGGLHESPMLVSDLASARKFMGWPGTGGRAEGTEMRGGWAGVQPSEGTQPTRCLHSPQKELSEGQAVSRCFQNVLPLF